MPSGDSNRASPSSQYARQAASTGDVTIASRQGTRDYTSPVEIVTTHHISKLRSALARVNRLVESGLHAAGFLSYEATPAFDSAMKTHPPGPEPLLWFGIYEQFTHGPCIQAPTASPRPAEWEPLIGPKEYEAATARIRQWLSAGDSYQVNYTFPMHAPIQEDPFALFASLYAAQPCDYAAFVDTGRFKILSLSPELFFRLDGDRLTTKPMKGTASRGLSYEDDLDQERILQQSPKERAENVMIVDLIRNDLGRISKIGTVKVDSLFDAERYDTLWQMTSSISSETEASLPEIFEALFPSGSVTGAPKIRTMEIIRQLETGPRGVYCGAVGWMAPERKAQFNVAIRTLTIDMERQQATYPIGSGITWDSAPQAEYEECLLKASVLHHKRPDFDLLESILWDGGYFLLDEHLQRLSNSATYFGIHVDLALVRRRLTDTAHGLSSGPQKIRLQISRSGAVHIDSAPAHPLGMVSAAFATRPIDSTDTFLYHKTTHRRQYEALRQTQPLFDDVLLWNELGEVTESTRANIVIKRAGLWITPPVSSGLLPGVMRNHLLQAGEISEAVITKSDLVEAESIALINSVRKWIEVKFAGQIAA